MLAPADLPDDIAALKAMLIASEARNNRKDERIERLEKLVAAFRQAAFGRRSEKSDPDQFELALEDLETAIAVIHAEEDAEEIAYEEPAHGHEGGGPKRAVPGGLPEVLADEQGRRQEDWRIPSGPGNGLPDQNQEDKEDV